MPNLPTQQFVNKVLPEPPRTPRYKIGKFLDGGSFGSVHLGQDVQSRKTVAIKFEWMAHKTPQLKIELNFYRRLGNRMKFIPILLFFGEIEGYNALVMECLGPSLSSMMKTVGGTYSLATTTQLLFQLFNIFEYVHACKLLYRDIKPQNFLFGLPNTSRWCTVYVIDLGFCKPYQDEYGEHIPWVEGKAIAGTALFMSSNNHFGNEVSRRDDLEALMYMALYMHKEHLPWVNMPHRSVQEHTMIGQAKASIYPEELFNNMPPQYGAILRIIRELDFTTHPPYMQFKSKLLELLTMLGIGPREGFYDFGPNHKKIHDKLTR